jgi:Uroporphyrinogen decarboxylase (URO-D)
MNQDEARSCPPGMSSRGRVAAALEHREADRVPLDLGGTSVSGMHVSSVFKLRQALGLDPPGTPVKVIEPCQMLGEIAPDLIEALGVDVVGVGAPTNFYGFRNEGWKQWTAFDGVPLLVPGDFNTEPEPAGDLLMYPCGDRSAPPCARMPKDGYYFDMIVRQPPIDDEHLKVEDNLEEFGPVTDEALEYMRGEIERLLPTECAIVADLGLFAGAFGEVAALGGPTLRRPKGIRDTEEFYISLVTRPEYVRELFDRQCEIALANLAKVHEAVGESISAIIVALEDLGTQNGPLVSGRTYRELFKPHHVRLNAWIHSHTQWKTFFHCCGSIWRLLDDILDAGFDILNPVQTSAAEMDAARLKATYGERVTFWGGGVDTQYVLPFGTPDEVRAMVYERMRIFGRGGGFVFSPIHNVQARVPVENLIALYDAVADYRSYPLADTK